MIIRVAERGIVLSVKSLNPLGFVNRPPDRKNSIIKITTHARSEIVIAKAMLCAPSSQESKPPVNTIESTILTISSTSSVDENATNFLRPQNQLRKDAYSVDVKRVGSIMKKIGKQSGFENRGDIFFPSPKNSAQIAADMQSPIIIEAVASEFCFLRFPLASAILRESTVGAPAVIVKSIKRVLSAI